MYLILKVVPLCSSGNTPRWNRIVSSGNSGCNLRHHSEAASEIINPAKSGNIDSGPRSFVCEIDVIFPTVHVSPPGSYPKLYKSQWEEHMVVYMSESTVRI